MTDAELDAIVAANVATWPPLTTERKAELRRILLGATPAQQASKTNPRRRKEVDPK